MKPFFAVERTQRWSITVSTRGGSTSVMTPSHPPLKPKNKCSIEFDLMIIPHPREHFAIWKKLQQKVHEAVDIAKERWSCHLAEEIHNMPFNNKGAWVSIRRLMGGETSHHTTPKLIHMRLPSGILAENEEENVSVFASPFKKVLNNHKPTDTIVINDIHLREVMNELDVSPLWTEFISAFQELTNDKSPGLNGVPPNAFKSMSEENLRHHFNFITDFWEGKVDFEEWHRGQVVPVPKT